MITHKNNMAVDNLSFKWKAPTQYVGDVEFKATIVADYDNFWVNVKTALPAGPSSLSPALDAYPVIQTSNLVNAIDFSACGDTKGCLLYPLHCTDDDCVAAATYQYRPTSADYLVELFTSEGPNYISFGLSDDDHMGNDATFTCAIRDGFMSIQEGWNPAYHNERQLTRSISGLEIQQKDGNTVCRFIMPTGIEVYHVNLAVAAFNYSTQLFNAREEWYLMLAWGNTMPESDVITYHKEMPITSFSKVDLASKSISYGSAFHIMVRVHGAIMIVAWILFTGIVTIISRYFKDWMPESKLCGTKVWFQFHRGMAIMVAVLTGIGLAVIFAHYGSEIRDYATPHAYVGLSVTACVGVQIIMGMLRPGAEHSLRPLYNWGHAFVGLASHILSAVTMFLAFDIDYVTPPMRKFGFITLSVWVVTQVLWFIIFEVISRRNKPSDADPNKRTTNGDVRKPSSKFQTVMLCLYILSLMILCVAVMLAFLFF